MEPFGWLDDEAGLDAAIAEAMQRASTWQEGCVMGAIAVGAPEDEASDGSVWSSWVWDDRPIFTFATVHMAGSVWSLFVRELAGTAFLLSDVDEPFEEYVWARWTPPGDRDALERLVRETWLEHWSDIALPPAFCGADVIWQGPTDEYGLAHRCVDELIQVDDRAWSAFRDRLNEVVEGLRHLAGEGLDLEEVGGNLPRPVHDLAWLETIVSSPFLDGCRRDDTARRSLVSYFLMS